MLQTATIEDWQQAVQRLAPVVAEYRDELDVQCRLPQPIFESLADAGLLRLWLPKAIGGPQISPEALLSVVGEAAQLDASVGWIIGVAAGSSLGAGHLTETSARQLFESRRAFCAHVVNPSGTAQEASGGYLVNGIWSFASGIQHATMIMANCVVAGTRAGEAPVILSCFVPREQVLIKDDWHVSGLRGTGSRSFEARNVFVPQDRVFRTFIAEPLHSPKSRV